MPDTPQADHSQSDPPQPERPESDYPESDVAARGPAQPSRPRGSSSRLFRWLRVGPLLLKLMIIGLVALLHLL